MRVIQVALLLGVLTAVVATEQNPELEYEDDGGFQPSPSPSPSPSPARSRSPLLPQRKPFPPVSSNRLNKLPTGDKSSAQKSTTTEAAPVVQEVQENQEDYPEQAPEEVPVEATSTEAPKKVNPVKNGRQVRPNDDLLAILKRKRQQAISTGTVAERTTTTTTTTNATPQSSFNRKSGFSNSGRRGRTQKAPPSPAPSQASSNEEVPEAEAPEVEPPRKPQSRKFNSRNSPRTTAAPVDEYEEVQQQVEEQPRQKHYRGPPRRS